MNSGTVAIVNPVAGRTHGAKLRKQALEELKRLFPEIQVVESRAPGHATKLAKQSTGCELVIAVGGEGTVRETASGLIGSDVALAIIPVGSGNDFCKTLGIPSSVKKACYRARYGKTRKVDAVKLAAEQKGTSFSHIFVNAAGFGFDATVTAEAQKLKRLRGRFLYLSAVFRAIRDLRCPLVRIEIENHSWKQHVLLIAAANGKFYGGGMKIAPDAVPDDGLLDICVIDAMGRLTAIRYLPRLVRGTHPSLKEVTIYRSPWLKLEFLEPVEVQLDGDLLPFSDARNFRLEVRPTARKGSG